MTRHMPPVQKRRSSAGTGKSDTDLEPVFFNELPKVVVEELLHMGQAKAVIDLTAGAGTWALVCLEKNLPYFGVALTDLHCQELLARLIKQASWAPPYNPTRITTPSPPNVCA